MEATNGIKLLSSLFLSRKKGGYFDIPSFMLKGYVFDGTVPSVSSNECVYGKFTLFQDLESFIYNDEDAEKITEENFKTELPYMRQKMIKHLVDIIDPLWFEQTMGDYIDMHDVNEFTRSMAQNKIWTDGDIREMTPVLLQYLRGASTNQEEIVLQTADDRISQAAVDMMTPEQIEEREKQTWQKYVLDDYRTYIDRINLVMLKQLLTDHLGNSFNPQ